MCSLYRVHHASKFVQLSAEHHGFDSILVQCSNHGVITALSSHWTQSEITAIENFPLISENEDSHPRSSILMEIIFIF